MWLCGKWIYSCFNGNCITCAWCRYYAGHLYVSCISSLPASSSIFPSSFPLPLIPPILSPSLLFSFSSTHPPCPPQWDLRAAGAHRGSDAAGYTWHVLKTRSQRTHFSISVSCSMLTRQHMSLSLYVLLLAVVIAGRTHYVQVVCGTFQLMQTFSISSAVHIHQSLYIERLIFNWYMHQWYLANKYVVTHYQS